MGSELGGGLGKRAGAVASAVGRGLAAGLFGTVVMTAGQLLEMKIQGREMSTTPAEAVKKLFGLEPRDEAAEQRLANLTHCAYGTAWGGVRGLLGAAGLEGSKAGSAAGSVAHFAAIWGAAAAMLPALDLAPPVTEWPPEQIATDALHHAVYAAATGVAYAWLSR